MAVRHIRVTRDADRTRLGVGPSYAPDNAHPLKTDKNRTIKIQNFLLSLDGRATAIIHITDLLLLCLQQIFVLLNHYQ
jgi:hypothetical protein